VPDRRVVYYVATSLDGFVARDDGAVDWLFTEGDFGFEVFSDSVDTVLMGRRTYEQVLGFAEYPYHDKKGYVFSRSRAGAVDDHVRFLDDPPSEVVESLRAAPGGHLWLVGGGELAASFLAADLIDDLRVAIHPVVLGRGRPLFGGEPCERHFRLTSSRSHRNGLVQCEYVRARESAPTLGGLGLFTAISRLRAVHRRIGPALEDAGLPLLSQHVDGLDVSTLVDIFRAEEESCLLGTDAIRDGVDVPGRALRRHRGTGRRTLQPDRERTQTRHRTEHGRTRDRRRTAPARG
jgi:dihydrofolate reductase